MSAIVHPRSRFTPSLMPHELLERLFVAREQVLDRIVARIESAATSSERNHTLLVGPRGSGKTHLVSLAYYRARDLRDSGAAVQLAWLPEDPWTIVSYRHLLRAIAERLEPSLEPPLPAGALELETLLVRCAELGGPIVVIVENLDQILDALGDEGQQQLRHVLQTHRPFLLIATSTRIDRALSDQARPFYGFFTTTRLEPFDISQAAAMLSAIAAENEDRRLVDYLRSDEGKTRLRTIAHLAGGQPRIWALLASALTVEGLGELVELLLTQFDDLTPYYQEQLGRLSGQQRLIIAELADIDRPINVAELARRLDIDQRSLSKTLGELVDRGWITPTQSALTARLDRRRTYYELAEPLARISFQIKDARGEPLRLIVEFLKHWFDPGDLRASIETVAAEYVALAVAGQEHDPVLAVTRRLHRLPVTRAPAVELLGEIDDALAALGTDDPEPLLALPTPIRTALERQLEAHDLASVRMSVHRAAWDEFGSVPHPAMAAWVGRAERWIISASADDAAIPQILITGWLARAWRLDEAEEALTTMSETLGSEQPDTLTSRNNLASAYEAAGRLGDAIPLYEETLAAREQVLGPEHPDTLNSRNNLAAAYRAAGRLAEAIPLLECTIGDRDRILGPMHPHTLNSRNNLAIAYQAAGRFAEAIPLLEYTLRASERILGPEHPDTLISGSNLAGAYRAAGRLGEAISLYEDTLTARERILGPEHPSTLTTRNNLAIAYRAAGRLGEAISLYEDTLTARERILGPEHPDTITTCNNLATAYGAAGRLAEAISLYEDTLTARERILGPEHPDTLSSRDNLANAYQSAGRLGDAIPIYEKTLTARQRVLGPEHPATLTSRNNLASAYRSAGR